MLGIKNSIFDISTFGEIKEIEVNPFLEELRIDKHLVIKRFKKGEVVIPEQIEISDEESKHLTAENEELKVKGLEIAKRVYKQKAAFVLIYSNPIIDYKSLSESSFKIFFYILDKKLSLGIDYIVMTIPECCLELNMTRPTITKGIVELVKAKMIYRRADSVWWINPNYFYAGNRLKIDTK